MLRRSSFFVKSLACYGYRGIFFEQFSQIGTSYACSDFFIEKSNTRATDSLFAAKSRSKVGYAFVNLGITPTLRASMPYSKNISIASFCRKRASFIRLALFCKNCLLSLLLFSEKLACGVAFRMGF